MLVASRQASPGVQLVVPKFKAPAAKANKRTGKGDRHRPHAFVKGASVPVAVTLILVSLLSIWLSFDKVFGSQSPDNYSLIEIIAARSWCAPLHWPLVRWLSPVSPLVGHDALSCISKQVTMHQCTPPPPHEVAHS